MTQLNYCTELKSSVLKILVMMSFLAKSAFMMPNVHFSLTLIFHKLFEKVGVEQC